MNFSKLEALIDSMPKRGIPFFDLRVTRNGKTVYSHAVGYSDAAKNVPIDDSALYWLYSTTKVFTCTAAMRLVEEGKLHLDDPVSKYIPSFAELTVRQVDGSVAPAKTVMTVKHLFTMTGGIGPEHQTAPVIKEACAVPGATTLDVVSVFPKVPLYFEPGTHYRYGFCHDTLAAVVEVASGVRFSDYVKQIILDPLGMTDTGFRPTEEQKKRFAATYRYDNSTGTSQVIPTVNGFILTPEYDSGGAGIFSCAKDYIKFVTALACNGVAENGYRLLRPETIAQMEVNHLNPDALRDFVVGRLHGYGWGLCGRVHINPDFSLSKSSVGEFGWDGAGGCFAMVDRATETAIFYGMQVMGCSYSYIILQPLIRSLVFEALES